MEPLGNPGRFISALLLPQILQRLNDEHSLLLAPYLLNDTELITRLGFNARVVTEGFSRRNHSPRQAPFHGETLKHLLMQARPESLLSWFHRDWLPLWRAHSPGRRRQCILDGMKIPVPARSTIASKFQGSGCVKDEVGLLTYGCKAVWLQEIIDRKGVIVAMTIVPIQVHDLEAARPLVESFPFEPGSSLIMDRGFIDAAWITSLKSDLGVDVTVPMRRQMKQFQGIETLPSKKLTSVVFRILMGIGYNLLNFFLNSVHCATFEEFSLKTARQKKMVESNPDVILYTKATFAVLRLFRLMPILLNLDQDIREKLARLFKKLDLSPAPA